MKKLRVMTVLMVIVMIINMVYPNPLQAKEEVLTKENVVSTVNKEIKEVYKKNNYYEKSITAEGEEKELAYDLLEEQLSNMNKVLSGGGNDQDLNQSMLFRIAYGKPFTISANTQEVEEYLGYNPEKNYVENPKYKWNSWDGKRLDETEFMYKPWEKEYIPVRKGERDTQFNTNRNVSYKCPDGTTKTLTDAVQEGMNIRYANKTGADVARSGNTSKVVYLPNYKPKGGGEWIDYVDIVQPPTYYTWGQGYLYSADGMRYKGVAIAPYSLLKSDLWVETDGVVPVEERHLNKVTVSGLIKSNFAEDVETDFEWKIVGSKTHTPVKVVEAVGYGGIDTLSGKCTVPGKQRPANFEVTFIMPKEPVTVTFTIGRKVKNDELKIDNNTFTYTIALEPYDIEFANYELDYDERSKELEHSVGPGANIASVSLPGLTNATWDDSYMTGALDVNIIDNQSTISSTQIQEGTNDDVNEQATSVTRSPVMEGVIVRSDYDDNPPSTYGSNNSNPIHKMLVTYAGNVARPYKYHSTHDKYCCTNKDGSSHYTTCNSCSDLNSSGIATERFNAGEDRITVKTKIYNGRKAMPHVAARDFKQQIDHNVTTSFKKTIWWESEEYPLLVQRWMKDIYADGTYDEVEIQGQYERIFSHQNQATVEWRVEEPISTGLKEDRDNARRGGRSKGDYPHAPFATDRDLQRFEYPFKSGYYFNPIGTYEVTIHTEIFKDEIGETEEHKALVDAQIAAFNFGSSMLYNLNGAEQLRMQFDDPEAETPTTQIQGKVLLEATRDYNYVNEIQLSHSPDNPEANHRYFKEILEGYSESSTQDSLSSYKYQEFIQDGQEIYKIIEETKVTITVNPDNTMLKTYGGMKDGNYFMTAWITDQNISHITGKDETILKGVHTDKNLDDIKITVKGSMYDDLNN